MGLLDRLKNWRQRPWLHDASAAVANYSYQTMIYMLEQVPVIPKVVRSIILHQPTQQVARHIIRITLEDLAPLALVSYISQCLQDKALESLDDEKHTTWINTDTTVQVAIYVLQAATWAYTVRKKTQIAVRTILVTLEAPYQLNRVTDALPMTICSDERCSRLRFLQGSLRDMTTYWATEAAISLSSYIPIAGGSLAAMLTVCHRGRYVLTVALPDLCNRHQMIYLQEHPELALSLGIGHATGSWFINSLVQTTTGIPFIFYASTIEQFMLIVQISIAAHIQLPKPTKASTRSDVDPVRMYQNTIGFLFDVVSLGLKMKIPRMLNNGGSRSAADIITSAPWSSAIKYTKMIGQHKLMQTLLPSMVRDRTSFLRDPIVHSIWPSLQIPVLKTLQSIENVSNSRAIRLSSQIPTVTSTIVETFLGTPKFMTRFALELMRNEIFLSGIRSLRLTIERFYQDESIPLSQGIDQNQAWLIIDQQERPQAEEEVKSDEIIRPQPASSIHPIATPLLPRDDEDGDWIKVAAHP
jgi:hypothetical protein